MLILVELQGKTPNRKCCVCFYHSVLLSDCSWIRKLWGGGTNPFPTIVRYGSEHVKLVAVDVFIHVVYPTILEAVYSDILKHFAGNE